MAKPLRIARYFATNALFASAAAGFVAETARRSILKRGRFTVALSGGSTPALLYEALARSENAKKFPWNLTHFFWGDERIVPFGDPGSNAGAAFRLLFSKVPVPEGNLHLPPVELSPPERAARAWEEELKGFFGGLPVFDLVILGIGKDGHTASLFPGNPVLCEKRRWVLPVRYPNPHLPAARLTLTLPVLNSARCVLFLCGREKKAILRKLERDSGREADSLPAARVSPKGGLCLFVSGEPIG